MVKAEFSEGISETLEILQHMEKKYIDKIPKKLKEFFENNKSPYYISNLEHSKKIEDMNLKEETKDILATIYINYWCTPQEKIEYISLLHQNEEKYQNEIRQKYNVDNIFQKKVKEQITKEKDTENEVSLLEYRETIFMRLISKIKKILHI